jgi:hypothetical protein
MPWTKIFLEADEQFYCSIGGIDSGWEQQRTKENPALDGPGAQD